MLYWVAGCQRGCGTGKHLIASGSRTDRVVSMYFIFDLSTSQIHVISINKSETLGSELRDGIPIEMLNILTMPCCYTLHAIERIVQAAYNFRFSSDILPT